MASNSVLFAFLLALAVFPVSTAGSMAGSGGMQSEKVRDARLLDAELQDLNMQRLLMATGNLDADAGRASLHDLRKAIADFRSATDSSETGPLLPAEREALERAADEVNRFAGFGVVQAAGTRISLTLPKNLFSSEPEAGTRADPNWTTYVAAGGGMKLHVFRYPLYAETPLSLFSRMIERRKNINIEHVDLATRNFSIEATADWPASGNKFLISMRGWESGKWIIGFQAWFDVAQSPLLRVPDLRIPAAEKSTYWVRQATEKIDPIEGNWRRVVKAIVNRIASDFEEQNGATMVSTKDCAQFHDRRGGHGSGDLERRGDARFESVRVVFATDRIKGIQSKNRDGRPDLDALFENKADGAMHLGCAWVSVPRDDAARAELALPLAPLQGGTALDRGNHFAVDHFEVLHSSRQLGLGQEVALVDEGYNQTADKALLYIHGYNTSFASALLRVAQIAAAINYKGRVYLFSWPSRAKLATYFDDMDQAERSEMSLQYFLRLVLRDGNVKSLDVLSHSMGAQGLLRSMDALRPIFDRRVWMIDRNNPGDTMTSPNDRLRLGQVIFAAPDVSSPVFEKKVAALAPFARRVTVYTSALDLALKVSLRLRFQQSRAGLVGFDGDPVYVEGADNIHVIEAMDSTGPSKLLWPVWSMKRYVDFNHNYFARNPAVLADIQSVLRDGVEMKISKQNPTDRRLRDRLYSFDAMLSEVRYKHRPDQVFWQLRSRPLATTTSRESPLVSRYVEKP